MKKLSCFALAMILVLLAGFPGAMAVCDGPCQRFDIWQRCYVNEDDRTQVCTRTDKDGDGFCDECSDRLCYVDENGDGQCDTQKECEGVGQKCGRENSGSAGHRGGKNVHRNGGRKHCR